jgi:HAE1 family hydrophobic/amphiphilic exporter-1
MNEIVKTLFALVLVIIVVFIFLQMAGDSHSTMRNASLACRHVHAIPLFGFSINTLSLFGVVLAVDLVVDNFSERFARGVSRKRIVPNGFGGGMMV